MRRDLATLRKKLHLFSGLVLATFILGHFGNLFAGLVSIEAMEAVRHPLHLIWHSWPGTILLYGALFSHFAMALDSLYRRQTLRMPLREGLKIAFGLSLPFLLVAHVVGTRLEYTLSGFSMDYPRILRILWSNNFDTYKQSFALIAAWSHGCLGIWFWLRGKVWFERYQLALYSAAILVPVIALIGFTVSARSLDPAVQSLRWFEEGRTDPATLATLRQAIYIGLLLAIGAVLAVRAWPSRGRVRITYPDGRIVPVTAGFSVLEASRSAGIPHLSICGGRGRCSTCRVRITSGLNGQPDATEAESITLKRIRAPVNVRLACQLRPVKDLTIAPVLGADSMGLKTSPSREEAAGRERQIAVLFCDLRDFTQLAQKQLPFDTVFLLNRYFETIGEAVESSGGIIDKFIGDGVLALFGLNTTVEEASTQALAATVRIGKGVEILNRSFTSELEKPLRIAMGMHAGPAIIGYIGYGKASALTAVGDTINAASRLEGFAKEYDAELAVSADVVRYAGLTLATHDRHHISIRGRTGTLETLIIQKTADIAGSLPSVDSHTV